MALGHLRVKGILERAPPQDLPRRTVPRLRRASMAADLPGRSHVLDSVSSFSWYGRPRVGKWTVHPVHTPKAPHGHLHKPVGGVHDIWSPLNAQNPNHHDHLECEPSNFVSNCGARSMIPTHDCLRQEMVTISNGG